MDGEMKILQMSVVIKHCNFKENAMTCQLIHKHK